MDTTIFTGLPEMDAQILRNLPDKDLYNACQINIYASELCWGDKKLRTRFLQERERLKPQYVINPLTGRKILVGSPTYKKLMNMYS